VQELKPDIVILDLVMPIMNGFEAAREIRRISPNTKILIVSTYDCLEAEVAARQAGADAAIDLAEVTNLLTNAVENLTLSASGHIGSHPLDSLRVR
jgi:DNA-binding NarL/FixJ family response regulator